MRRQHPDRKMDIPISLEVWQQLLGASIASGYEKEDWEIAAEAIDEWVRRHTPESISMPLTHGYQWKSVFLPDGTLLRTVFGGKNYHCLVEGDRILYNGLAVSPSGFVNAVGGIRRNAWQCTWILLPNSKDWKLADTLRPGERPRRVRNRARDIQQAPATQTVPARVPDHVAPVAGPLPAQSEYGAAGAPEPSHLQHTRHGRAAPTNPHAERRNRRQNPGMPLSPAGFTRHTERRKNGDERLVALLRQELLPLLCQMSSLDGTSTVDEPRNRFSD